MMTLPFTVPWRVIAAAALAAGIFAAGWTTNGWRKEAEIEQMKAETAQADLKGAKDALDDLVSAGKTIRAKADEFNGIQTTLVAKMDAIRKDLKNAPKLPADCRPDDVRVRNLSDAVDAANAAAAGR